MQLKPSGARPACLAALLLMMISVAGPVRAAGEDEPGPCNEDAMLIFDASGSMAGTEKLGVSTAVPLTRIDKVRQALARVLPAATRYRRVGLITYGPGPYAQCNVKLNLKPVANAASLIMRDVETLVPAGKTPLSESVQQAADVLKYRDKPGVIVLLTDGEETCGGNPCDLGKKLRAEAAGLVVHVIAFRVKDFTWMGGQSILDTKCLADENSGLYIEAGSEEELAEAFEKTLGCPMLSMCGATPATVR
ncbi:MAG: VWA domain-containing protein [Methylibium sp.]|jgi:Ca-activated chloride channel family protein